MDRETEQRSIRNRDIPLLQNVYAMMQKIVSLEHRRMWQRERMNNITQHLTGMPGGGGTPKGIDEAFAAISELEEEHKNLVKQYARELKRAERIINAIESGSMRAFVSMMYLDNIPGNEVRQKLNLTRWGFERAKEAIEQAEDMAHVAWHERYILGDGNRAENFQ